MLCNAVFYLHKYNFTTLNIDTNSICKVGETFKINNFNNLTLDKTTNTYIEDGYNIFPKHVTDSEKLLDHYGLGVTIIKYITKINENDMI